MLKIIESQEITMGTREIAEMLGKQHSNIKISAERLAAAGVIGTLAPQEFTHLNNTYIEYRLNKRDSLILVAQNSPEFTARIVDRWQELEAKQAPAIPKTYAEALLEAGRLAMEVERQAEQLSIAAPKVDFADRVASAEKGVLIGNFAKSVGIGQRKIFDILRNEKILMTGGNRHNLPFQEYMDRGYFEVSEGTFDDHGETRLSFTPLITGKGQQWLTTKLISKGHLKAVAANDNKGGAS